jgi:uroporphyrinogen decarboxylase
MSLPLFLRACQGEATAKPPLWMMRQAGRYLPEYRQIREKVSFLELCKNPALAAEVTLQPLRRFGFDAAILFSDLLVPLEAMGLAVEFTEQGPRLPQPVRGEADLARVELFDPRSKTDFVLETIDRLKGPLGDTPLIGFAGAPFTVATYAIEGKTSKSFSETKKLFYRTPDLAKTLLARLAESTASYLEAQIAAGAKAVQLFDSWVGVVSPDDWERFVFEPTAKLIARVRKAGVPVIYFANGATTIFDRVGRVGADVYGVDWRLPLGEARRRLDPSGVVPVQGNLDPVVLLGPPAEVERHARAVLAQGERRGHIFNLGHGILPETPLESVETLVRVVRA